MAEIALADIAGKFEGYIHDTTEVAKVPYHQLINRLGAKLI
jgi:hypothetical protein